MADNNNNEHDIATATETTTSCAAMKRKEQKRKIDHVYFLVYASLYTFLYGGSFYGWGPMQLLLEANGSYSSKCSGNDDNDNSNDDTEKNATDDENNAASTICSKQTSSLLRIQFVSTLTVLLCPGIGWVVDQYGPLISFYGMIVCVSVAFVTLLLASIYDTIDPILYVSFVSFGIVANITAILSIQTGIYIYPNNEMNRSRVISFLNALFDGGSITYLGLWAISNTFHLSLMEITILYGGIAIFCCTGGLYYWTIVSSTSFSASTIPKITERTPIATSNNVPIMDPMMTMDDDSKHLHSCEKDKVHGNILEGTDCEKILETDTVLHNNNCTKMKENSVEPTDVIVLNDIVPGGARGKDIHKLDPNTSDNDDDNDDNELKNLRNGTILDPFDTKRIKVSDNNSCNNTDNQNVYIKISDRTPRKQLRSEPFIWLCIFFALHVTNNIYTLTTTRDFLAYLGDDDVNNKYLTIFTCLLPVSVIGLPVVDYIVTKFGFYGGLQFINILSIGQSAIKLGSTNLNVQILGFIIFTFLRCFLFAITLSYLPVLVSTDVNGIGVGIMFFASGIVGFINFPLSYVAVEQMDGNFFVSNLIIALLIVPCFFAAWRIGCCIQKEEQVTKENENIVPE